MQPKPFWQSTNFWTAVILAIGGLFVGFPESTGRDAVSAVFFLLSAGSALREYFQTAKVDVRAWLASKNTWNYIATALIAALPALPPDLFTQLQQLFSSLLGGNWQGAVTALFSIATILWYLLRPKPTTTLTAVLLLLLSATTLTAQKSRIVHCWRTVDGDTWQVSTCHVKDSTIIPQPFSKSYFVRLYGLDTPETANPYVSKDQPYGREAAAQMREITTGKKLLLDSIETDQYGRIVARLRLTDSTDVAKMAARNGWGWNYFPFWPSNPTQEAKKYRAEIEALQKEARKNKSGLWAGRRPITPSLWRRRHPGLA